MVCSFFLPLPSHRSGVRRCTYARALMKRSSWFSRSNSPHTTHLHTYNLGVGGEGESDRAPASLYAFSPLQVIIVLSQPYVVLVSLSPYLASLRSGMRVQAEWVGLLRGSRAYKCVLDLYGIQYPRKKSRWWFRRSFLFFCDPNKCMSSPCSGAASRCKSSSFATSLSTVLLASVAKRIKTPSRNKSMIYYPDLFIYLVWFTCDIYSDH